MNELLIHLLPLVAPLVDKAPEPEDVKAGWGAFAIFLGMAAVVVFLGFSLTKQLKKAQKAKDAGAFGDEPTTPTSSSTSTS